MVVPFNKKQEVNAVTLYDWYNLHHDEDDRRTLFVFLSKALKYIHDHGYCVMVFHPSLIFVLYDNPECIQFTKLMELPDDEEERKNIIKEDIFHSAFIQIGLYSNTLAKLSPDFLVNNFDSFVEFLPAGDAPYYRGVVQRGASIYFCQFDVEKAKRELADLKKQFGEKVDNQEESIFDNESETDLTNKKYNDYIYKQISGYQDAAFVHLLIIPTIAFVLLALFGVISWFVSILS